MVINFVQDLFLLKISLAKIITWSPSGNLLERVLFHVLLYSVSLYVIDVIIPSVIQGLLLNVRFVNFGFSSLQNLSIVSIKVLLNLTKSGLSGREGTNS